MPVMSGEEARNRIRKIEQIENRFPTPIIACAPDPQNFDRYLSEGFDAILEKVNFIA